ncbi:hypothetical protein [Streptomyces sp. NPDC056291]|uniref:hypothetical protein n=1 Tax=unclassified Streptomyces TaxID=2593676 RepID=UPI0035D5C408
MGGVEDDTGDIDEARGITAQYNKLISQAQVAEQSEDFERRRRALTRYHAGAGR